MKIGVLSDTRNFLDPKIPELFAGVSHILHAGDIGLPWILRELEAVAPVTAEQWIKEGKNAVKWTRLSCHDFADNQVRLQLFVLAYNLGNFLRRRCCRKRCVTGR
jgi:hypothetical protein